MTAKSMFITNPKEKEFVNQPTFSTDEGRHKDSITFSFYYISVSSSLSKCESEAFFYMYVIKGTHMR